VCRAPYTRDRPPLAAPRHCRVQLLPPHAPGPSIFTQTAVVGGVAFWPYALSPLFVACPKVLFLYERWVVVNFGFRGHAICRVVGLVGCGWSGRVVNNFRGGGVQNDAPAECVRVAYMFDAFQGVLLYAAKDRARQLIADRLGPAGVY